MKIFSNFNDYFVREHEVRISMPKSALFLHSVMAGFEQLVVLFLFHPRVWRDEGLKVCMW